MTYNKTEILERILDAVINGVEGHSSIHKDVITCYLSNDISNEEAEKILIEIAKLPNINNYLKIVHDEFGKVVIGKINTNKKAASELKELGGLQHLINEKEKTVKKEDYKEQLEIEKSEREIEKLKYEELVRFP